ncbi:MAG: ImmA/IrrE family metallo-endopeptidase [Clostridia bacterium]|nr:ImmA/IrrE family metallo-endopeptidase [Clostridia bacterium]
MNIKDTVLKIASEYKTRDPFEIADCCGIYIIREDLGAVNGYFTSAYGVKSIHLNENLSPERQKICCAHELGHALMHDDLNTYFLINSTMMLPDKYERQANLFASHLLFPDEVLAEYEGYDTGQIAAALGAPKFLIDLRLE